VSGQLTPNEARALDGLPPRRLVVTRQATIHLSKGRFLWFATVTIGIMGYEGGWFGFTKRQATRRAERFLRREMAYRATVEEIKVDL
jgi:hypothetical protein